MSKMKSKPSHLIVKEQESYNRPRCNECCVHRDEPVFNECINCIAKRIILSSNKNNVSKISLSQRFMELNPENMEY